MTFNSKELFFTIIKLSMYHIQATTGRIKFRMVRGFGENNEDIHMDFI